MSSNAGYYKIYPTVRQRHPIDWSTMCSLCREFYAESMQMMQMYSPGFEYEEKNAKLDMIEKIVELYVAFFSHSDCARRAD